GRLGVSAVCAAALRRAAGGVGRAVAPDGRVLTRGGPAGRAAGERPAAGTKPSIAILPFVNQSADPGREYFADGLTQDVINALGRFPQLTVMSWNAVFPYKGKPASPGEISRSLAVRYQVEGSVLQAGDRVRVTAQLVGADGQVLWS